MPDSVDEGHCVVCGGILPSEREAFRATLDALPLDDEQICDACLMAFWRNLGFPLRDDDSTRH